MIRRGFDYTCPSGVCYSDHIGSLIHGMMDMFQQGDPCSFFLTHPVTAAVLEAADKFKRFRRVETDEWPFHLGRIGGVSVWVDPSIGPNEILLVDDLVDPQPFGMIELWNLVDVPGPLDRLAAIPR